jgi:hypothetical protein
MTERLCVPLFLFSYERVRFCSEGISDKWLGVQMTSLAEFIWGLSVQEKWDCLSAQVYSTDKVITDTRTHFVVTAWRPPLAAQCELTYRWRGLYTGIPIRVMWLYVRSLLEIKRSASYYLRQHAVSTRFLALPTLTFCVSQTATAAGVQANHSAVRTVLLAVSCPFFCGREIDYG